MNRLKSDDHYMPKEEKNKMIKYVFGNIEIIYKESIKFCEALKTCGYDHEKIAGVFIKFVSSPSELDLKVRLPSNK